MDQNLGNALPSGKTEKKKSKRKKSQKNGKQNGKSNGHDRSDLSELNQSLAVKVSELETQIENMSLDLESARDQLSLLQAENRQLRKEGLGEREKVVLRNLRYFHGQVLNAQTHCKEDKQKLVKLCEEVSYAIKEQF